MPTWSIKHVRPQPSCLPCTCSDIDAAATANAVYTWNRSLFQLGVTDSFLPRDASAVLLRQVVCLSVCPSVREVEVSWSHIGWNTSKMISPLVSLGCSLFADDPDIIFIDLLQGEHPGIFVGIGVWCGKSNYKSSNISETRKDRTKVTIERSNRKSHTHIWLVPNSTASDDLQARFKPQNYENVSVTLRFNFVTT